jgi:hypothetical protein
VIGYERVSLGIISRPYPVPDTIDKRSWSCLPSYRALQLFFEPQVVAEIGERFAVGMRIRAGLEPEVLPPDDTVCE